LSKPTTFSKVVARALGKPRQEDFMPAQQDSAMAERLKLLTQTGPDTDMGRFLRRFWQPVAVSHAIKPGQAVPLRVLGEDLALYRGESGTAHLVGGRCAHRLTVLHTGWVQGDEIR
jgi:5,5'-dehydrodivanillate O-demethylase oxygenase subunit